MNKWKELLGADDMNVDKGVQYPEWEGNECLLTCPTTNGMTFCLWRTPNYATIQEFQGAYIVPLCRVFFRFYSSLPNNQITIYFFHGPIEFIDRFTGDISANKCYAVDEAIGIKKLDFRGYVRDFINVAQGRTATGYLDAPMLWLEHHHITGPENWKTFTREIVDYINKKCNTPSDCINMFTKGYACPLTLSLGEMDAVCLGSSPAATTKEEYQQVS